jgi:hypothetical protein
MAYTYGAVAAEANFSLYAYGKSINSGMKMFYGDGKTIALR